MNWLRALAGLVLLFLYTLFQRQKTQLNASETRVFALKQQLEMAAIKTQIAHDEASYEEAMLNYRRICDEYDDARRTP